MDKKDIAIGQMWKRADGRMVKIKDERMSRGSREFLLMPVGSKGRESWKWDGGIINELTYVQVTI